jgi:protocatechuate 3,4-dioxygenase alpha subunit
LILTSFQTIGPFFASGLEIVEGDLVASEAADGVPIVVEGVIRDGAGEPVPDAVVEVWQANAAGRYRHPSDTRTAAIDPACDGFGRVATTADGRFAFRSVLPGPVPGPDGRLQAPHLLVGVLARGIQTRLITRIYFEDQPSHADDPVLSLVPADRRATLLARRADGGRYLFDIALQGRDETVFFDV